MLINSSTHFVVLQTDMMSIPDLIKKKRDGGALSDEEIKTFIHTVTKKTIQESQIGAKSFTQTHRRFPDVSLSPAVSLVFLFVCLGAMLMAIWQKGMFVTETETLTREMMLSGEVMSWPDKWAGLVVDKHSTGGVGDKVSMVLAPALAACGCKVNTHTSHLL